ncbi:hypothetical protein SVIOM74S_06769 [Streptomyces violarus]
MTAAGVHGYDRQLQGEFRQSRGGGLRAEQDQRLAAVGEQRLGGTLLAAPGGHGTQRDLVAGRFGRRVDALDQVGVERLLEAELHPSSRERWLRNSRARASGR